MKMQVVGPGQGDAWQAKQVGQVLEMLPFSHNYCLVSGTMDKIIHVNDLREIEEDDKDHR